MVGIAANLSHRRYSFKLDGICSNFLIVNYFNSPQFTWVCHFERNETLIRVAIRTVTASSHTCLRIRLVNFSIRSILNRIALITRSTVPRSMCCCVGFSLIWMCHASETLQTHARTQAETRSESEGEMRSNTRLMANYSLASKFKTLTISHLIDTMQLIRLMLCEADALPSVPNATQTRYSSIGCGAHVEVVVFCCHDNVPIGNEFHWLNKLNGTDWNGAHGQKCTQVVVVVAVIGEREHASFVIGSSSIRLSFKAKDKTRQFSYECRVITILIEQFYW